MMKPMTSTPTPLVTREALQAFTQRLVEHYAPEKVILYSCGEACGYGSLARGEGRWDSDADILVVMPFEGRHLAKIREMRRLCPVRFPLDLLVRRPEEVEVRYRGGDPVVREAPVKFLRNGRILIQHSQ
jgi:predicted nucleotidyltransferase